MFQKYKSKPKTINAIQLTEENKNKVFNSLTGQYAPDNENGKPVIKITTIHGDTAIVRVGDWIVKESVEGVYYPVENGIFKLSYAKCEDE